MNITVPVIFHPLRLEDKRAQRALGAHLRKRSKVTVEPIIENPRGII